MQSGDFQIEYTPDNSEIFAFSRIKNQKRITAIFNSSEIKQIIDKDLYKLLENCELLMPEQNENTAQINESDFQIWLCSES